MAEPRNQDAGPLALLDELRRAAIAEYGEGRASEPAILFALEMTATAAWRVMAEPMEPDQEAPYGVA